MDLLDRLDTDTRSALVEHVSRIKHDLGRYVAFQVRWVAADAPLTERRAALAADLLATRRGPDGTRDAAEVWAEVRPALVGETALSNGTCVDLAADVAVVSIDRAIVEVVRLLGPLRGETADEADVRSGTDAALAIAEACRDLHRRVRGV